MKITETKRLRVPFSYLERQFSDLDGYLADIAALVKSGDFTLGTELENFETEFARLCQLPHAVGVGSGTDAIFLSLKLLGIGPGDEVITTPMTFVATVGAIVMSGARPIFVDSEDGFVIDPSKIEEKITPKSRAILPVHYTGNVADMPVISEIARKHGLAIVEDACQAISAGIQNQPVGSWGETACFSLHPLKNLNVWGDGGIIATRSKEVAQKLKLLRNHGLINRDEIAVFGYNSRLDTLQAVIGNRLIREMDFITNQRIAIAKQYDEAFEEVKEFVQVPVRRAGVRHVYHLYIIRAKNRNQLLRYLNENGVEAKIHYPVPVHLQPAARYLNYKAGDFPVCERDCEQIITLPAHQHLTPEEIHYTIERIKNFYLQ